MMKKIINAHGKIDSFGAISFQAATINYRESVGSCDCGGSISLTTQTDIEGCQNWEELECSNCYNPSANLADFAINYIPPVDAFSSYKAEKIWCKSKDYVEMSQGMTSMDWDQSVKGQSFEELAARELGFTGEE